MCKIVVIIFFLFLTSCSARFVPVRVPCGPDPEMKPVQVKDGAIPKEQVPNVIDNHMALWKRIHELKKKGCVE